MESRTPIAHMTPHVPIRGPRGYILSAGLSCVLVPLVAAVVVGIIWSQLTSPRSPDVQWQELATYELQTGDCGTWSVMEGTQASGFLADYKVGLTRVSASSRTNVWAIGILSKRNKLPTFGAYAFADSPDFVTHWNGEQWSQPKLPAPVSTTGPIPTPSISKGQRVESMSENMSKVFKAVESAGESAWLAARIKYSRCEPVTDLSESCWRNFTHAEIYRWQGTSWVRDTLPDSQNAVVYDMLALSESDVWAVGVRGEEGGRKADEQGKPWAWHWDGTTWTSAPQGLPQRSEPTSERLTGLGIDHVGRVMAGGETWDTPTLDRYAGILYTSPKSRTRYVWDRDIWQQEPGDDHLELTRPNDISLQSLSSSLHDWQSYKHAQKLPDGTIWAVGGYSGYGPGGTTNDLTSALAARFTPGPCGD